MGVWNRRLLAGNADSGVFITRQDFTNPGCLLHNQFKQCRRGHQNIRSNCSTTSIKKVAHYNYGTDTRYVTGTAMDMNGFMRHKKRPVALGEPLHLGLAGRITSPTTIPV